MHAHAAACHKRPGSFSSGPRKAIELFIVKPAVDKKGLHTTNVNAGTYGISARFSQGGPARACIEKGVEQRNQ